MATVTDTLETVFRVNGVSNLISGLTSGTAGFQKLAAAEGVAAAGAAKLGTAFNASLGPIGLALTAITAVVGILGKGLSAFSESEAAVARIAIRMKGLGDVFPTKELLEFASAQQRLTGFGDELIATLGVTAAQFGLTRDQIEKTLPAVLDIAQGLGKGPQEVLQTLLRASRGRTQGLVALGIDPSKIKGDVKDINNLIRQIGGDFAGVASAFRSTLPGTVNALKEATGDLFEALGRFISPVVVPLLNLLIKGIEQLTALLTKLADFLGLPTAAELAERTKTSELALKGDPEQTELLGTIASNTAKTADALVKQVLGGPGGVARGAATWRDFRVAFGQ